MFVNPTVCASKDHFAWDILQSLSTDCRAHAGFSGSPWAIVIDIFQHTVLHQTCPQTPRLKAIFMYRLLCLFVPWSSPFETLAGKKKKKIRLHYLFFLNGYGNLYEQIAYCYITITDYVLLQLVDSVSHTKKRSLAPPSTFLCELMLIKYIFELYRLKLRCC